MTLRLLSLDVLRGVAILGILVPNITSFGLPLDAAANPLIWHENSEFSQWVWMVITLFFGQKFLSMFSMLFGAGLLLFLARAEKVGSRSGVLHLRRMIWLGLFGVLHGTLIWSGDILLSYALCGVLLWLFRNRSIRGLLIWSSVHLSFATLVFAFLIFVVWSLPPAEQKELSQSMVPIASELQSEVQNLTGSWAERIKQTFEDYIEVISYLFPFYVYWKTMASMLIGMALFRSGFLTGQWSNQAYWITVGLTVPLPLFAEHQAIEHLFATQFLNYDAYMWYLLISIWGSTFCAVGYASLVMLLVKSTRFTSMCRRLAVLGQMSFSNYIFQSLIATTLFYQFGLFGQFEFSELMGFVGLIWCTQFFFTLLWLQRYRQGPLEWVWRSLTYWRLQPIEKQPAIS